MTSKILTCVLVDDEKANIEILTDYIKQIPYLKLNATFDKPIEALTFLLKTPTDLLITDINMPRLSGIELYQSIYNSVSTQVVFISGYNDKIIEALQFSVVDYLCKPVSINRFEQAVKKALVFSNSTKKNVEYLPIEILELALENYDTLSESEKKVLKFISNGSSTQKIAESVFTSVRTIEAHRYTIRKKLKLSPEYNLIYVAKFITESLK